MDYSGRNSFWSIEWIKFRHWVGLYNKEVIGMIEVYIAGVNDVDYNNPPIDLSTDEDNVSVSLPLSVRVNVEEGSGEFDVEEVKLQWRHDSEGTWTDITPAYSDVSKSFIFTWDEYHFGRSTNATLTSDDGITAGDTILIRLYIANPTEGYQNANLGVDTTDEGTNGWEDPWVKSFVIQDNIRPGGGGRGGI